MNNERTKKKGMGINMGKAIICALTGIVLQGLFIAVEHKEKYVPAVILKGLASAMFVAVGLFGRRVVLSSSAVTGADEFVKFILIGLILGLVGDVLLNLRFVFKKIGQKIFLLGIVAFLAGHIFYLVALIPSAQNLLVCIIVGAVTAAVLLFIIFKTMEVKLAFKIFGIVYIGAVVIMTAVAIGNLIADPTYSKNIIFAIGAVLFTASDVVLIFNTFGKETKFALRITNLSLYYIGQLLIAGSMFFIGKI